MAPDPLGQCLLLLGKAKLKELLDDVVAKDIGHQAVGCTQDLTEDHLSFGWSSTLQLLLYEARPMLVLRQETEGKVILHATIAKL